MPKRNVVRTQRPTDSQSKGNVSLPVQPVKVPAPTSSAGPSEAGLEVDSSAAQQLELELCWCIQQLQGALTSPQMSSKQSSDALRSLNVLKNISAPLVKKRQIMRATFGDYRNKMAEEEKKFKKAKPQMKLETSSPNKNSRFFKRSAFKSAVLKFTTLEQSDNSFRFNFSQSKDANVENEEVTVKEKESADHSPIKIQNKCVNNDCESALKMFKYNISDNSFRFDFQVEDNKE